MPEMNDKAIMDDPTAFREAMARLAATVHIVTTQEAGKRYGLTITAASSLSADPMSIIISVNRDAAAHAPMLRSKKLCLNMLTLLHDNLAMRFAGALGHRGEDRFNDGDWQRDEDWPPVLRDAAAALYCNILETHPFGTHSVMLCEVDTIHLGATPAPLIYANRHYGTVQHITAGVQYGT